MGSGAMGIAGDAASGDFGIAWEPRSHLRLLLKQDMQLIGSGCGAVAGVKKFLGAGRGAEVWLWYRKFGGGGCGSELWPGWLGIGTGKTPRTPTTVNPMVVFL